MTRRHYRVGPSLWNQPWDDDMRLVAVYLMTCKHRHMEGLYHLPLAYGPADMGWPQKRFERAFNALIADGFIRYDAIASVVWLVNALEWQTPANPNQCKAAAKALRELPPNSLLNDFLTVARTVSEPFAKALDEQFGKRIANTPSPSPSPTPQTPQGAERTPIRFGGRAVPEPRRIVAEQILLDFNRQAQTSYRPLTATGKPTDEFSRILGALTEDERLTAELAHRMIAQVLAGQHYWEPGPVHPGHVFGAKTRGPLLDQALKTGTTTSADFAAAVNRANGDR